MYDNYYSESSAILKPQLFSKTTEITMRLVLDIILDLL